jgi:hypothetical protein
MPNPTNVHTLRSFIKLCNYYRIYVPDFSIIGHPLYALLKKNVAWTWSEEAREAFNTLKEKLSEFPILRRPNFNKVFILHTNWSALGIGAILGQLDEEGKRICYRICIPKQQQGWEQLFFIWKGMSYCYMGHHTFQAVCLQHQFHFVYWPSTYQVVDDQRQAY